MRFDVANLILFSAISFTISLLLLAVIVDQVQEQTLVAVATYQSQAN